MLELTHMRAVHELLTAKSLLDRYATLGLTDATTLRQAVVEAAGKLHVVGKANTVTHQAATEGNLAISYAMADEAALTAQLLQPDEVEKVRIAYRDVMHRQARELMKAATGPMPSCSGNISTSADWFPSSFTWMRLGVSSNSTKSRICSGS